MLGLLIIFTTLLIPVPFFADLANQYDKSALFSQYLGAVSLILMSLCQIFATRMKGLETLFGGLDHIYVLHKWLGIFAMITMMLHDTIDAEIKNLGRETWLTDIAEESGEIALYGLLILVVITLITFIPYELWKRTHKFIGLFFAMSAFHYLFMIKPFSDTSPLGFYLSAFSIAGIASYIYCLMCDRLAPRSHPYQVTNIKKSNRITELELSPTQRGITHKAGQFAFLTIKGETHPFTIASAPTPEGTLRFCIKSLGDFTSNIASQTRLSDQVSLSRAFGNFKLSKAPHQVWIAGGIGITPFLAWAQNLSNQDGRQIDLIYCVRSHGEQIPFLEELDHPNIKLHILNSAKGERLDLQRLKDILGAGFEKAQFSYCGPKSLRTELEQHIKLRSEEFEIRSGINLSALSPLMKKLFSFIFEQIKHHKNKEQEQL